MTAPAHKMFECSTEEIKLLLRLRQLRRTTRLVLLDLAEGTLQVVGKAESLNGKPHAETSRHES